MDLNASICNVCQKGATLFCSCEIPLVILCETCVSSHMSKRKGLPHEVYGLESYNYYSVPGYKEALARRMQSPGTKQIREVLGEIDQLKQEVTSVIEVMTTKLVEHGQTLLRELEELKTAVEADLQQGEEEMKAAIYLLSPQLSSPIAKVLWQAGPEKPVLMTCQSNLQNWVVACEGLLFSAVISMQIELDGYQPSFAISHVAELSPTRTVSVYYSPRDVITEGIQSVLSHNLPPLSSLDRTPILRRGPIRLENEEFYLGDWNQNHQMHGYGQWWGPAGEMYEGEWKCGLREGRGKSVAASGEEYEGLWVVNEKEGFGCLRDKCGSEYVGVFERGRKEKFGRIQYGDSNAALYYIGGFAQDSFSGLGSLWLRSGAQYSGGFKAGLKHGGGMMYWPLEGMYAGGFARDTSHGMGCYCWENGNVYDGQWVNGVMEGCGKLMVRGESYEGGWRAGEKFGQGVERKASGKEKKVVYSRSSGSALSTNFSTSP